MLKQTTQTIKKRGIHYILQHDGKTRRFKPWLGDSFSFLYDAIMEKSVFPKKFGGNMSRHFEILQQALQDIHNRHVLELATGTGNATNFLANDNHYTGTDISPGLLRKAVKRLHTAGFNHAECYVASADDLPFADDCFEVCLCHLSLNFFSHIDVVFQEVKRVVRPHAVFICSVPVPERNTRKSPIRGTLYSEDELKTRLQKFHFVYERITGENGALLYFKATLE